MPCLALQRTGIFASANLVSAIVSSYRCHAPQRVAALTASGIGAVMFAAVSPAREAIPSLRIKEYISLTWTLTERYPA